MLALSLTLVAGTVGQVSLGHAGAARDRRLCVGAAVAGLRLAGAVAILAAGCMTAALGTLLVSPAFRLRGHYVSIATLGDRRNRRPGDPELGKPDARPDRRLRHSAAVAFGCERARQPSRSTGSCLAVLVCRGAAAGAAAALASRPHPCARSGTTTSRRAATASGWIATRRWPSSSVASRAGFRGADHGASLLLHQPRNLHVAVSILALTMVILGGMGNVARRDPRRRGTGRPARGFPVRGRIPDADLWHRPAAPGPLPAAGPVGDGLRMAPLLRIRGLSRRFGGLTAVDGIDLDLARGRIRQHHRAERRRQDHVVQPDHRPRPARRRARSVFDGADITGLPPERIAALGIARTFQHGRVFGNLSVMRQRAGRRPHAPARRAPAPAGLGRAGRARAGADRARPRSAREERGSAGGGERDPRAVR